MSSGIDIELELKECELKLDFALSATNADRLGEY